MAISLIKHTNMNQGSWSYNSAVCHFRKTKSASPLIKLLEVIIDVQQNNDIALDEVFSTYSLVF